MIGIVKSVNDMTTVVGKASNREIKKRDVQLVDKTGVMIRMTLWGAEVKRKTSSLLLYLYLFLTSIYSFRLFLILSYSLLGRKF